MKKKILGLALALVMIISLLPLTAFAEDPATKVKIIVYDPNFTSSSKRTDISFDATSTYSSQKNEYITFEDVLDTDGTTVLGNKPVKSDTKPADGTPHIHANYEGSTLTITFNNIHYKRTANLNSQFMNIYKDTGTEFDINIVLNGENKIEGGGAYISSSNAGTFNISGEGSLEMDISVASKQCIGHTGAGDMTITDATLKLNLTSASSGQNGGILNNGAITLNNANVEFSGQNSFGLRVGSATSENTGSANVTINNSDYKFIHAAGQREAIETDGTVTFNNSNIELIANANQAKVLVAAPTIIGTYSSQKYSVREQGESFAEKDYTAAAFDSNIRYLKLVHECVAQADDGDCTTAVLCACGKEATAAKQHIAGANADDCTKDTMCGNAGCTKVFEAATATEHTAAADDGDCTTDIKCANCDQIVTKGAEKHVWDRTSCDVDGTCTTAGCTKTVAAGTHTGGTATCQAKAKCTDCGKEYGELGACAPAADDGDCTTDIKCSLCGKTTTAGEAAHKYTDKNDTTCDNAGCTNTRKVEGTENPKTGDNTALVLMVALMAVASAAFVTTKKFAR